MRPSARRGRVSFRPCALPGDVLSVFARFEREPHPFLLDSAMLAPGLGRYAFLGGRPFQVLTAKGRRIEIVTPEGGRTVRRGNPFHVLRELLSRYGAEGDCPVPFATGAVGYLAYDLCHHIERLPDTTVDDIGLPDLYMAFYDRFVAVDLAEGRAWLVANDLGEGEAAVGRKLDALEAALEAPETSAPAAPTPAGGGPVRIRSNFRRDDYLRAVQRAIDYIAAGDIFQVNLSQRFHVRLNLPPGEIYRRLRRINPAPFAGFLAFGDAAVISASPERFLRVRGREVETRPIKGTRPRGRNPAEDERLRRELLASEKDAAELTMIIDLERNDLGRVCEYGSVRVREAKALETYPTVFHLVGTVVGRLHPRHDLVDLLRAAFPGGSITGAPKIRAMEIIDEIEPTRRSVYTGSMGYIGFDGCADLNIVIRTMLLRGSDLWFQAGGGIVADSEPEAEYRETLDKARALIRAVGAGEDDLA